jgi:hypothetical protein
MKITITLDGERYQLSVRTRFGAPDWDSAEPMTATEVLGKLEELGVHSTDAIYALDEVDPGWTKKHDEEVARRRQLANSENAGDY